MFDRTKSDLSYDSTKLDFASLLETAKLGFGSTKYRVEQLYSELQNIYYWKDTDKVQSVTDRLATATEALAYIGETLAALNGAVTRSELIIVNKPEIETE